MVILALALTALALVKFGLIKVALNGAKNPVELDAEADLIRPDDNVDIAVVNVGVPLRLEDIVIDIAEPGRGVGLGLGGPSDSVPPSLAEHGYTGLVGSRTRGAKRDFGIIVMDGSLAAV
jgi:hypothetical protein